MVNLDTPILVFALTGEVTDRERRVLASNTWSVSAIVYWELAKLAQLGRIDIFEHSRLAGRPCRKHPVHKARFQERSRGRTDRGDQHHPPSSASNSRSPEQSFSSRQVRLSQRRSNVWPWSKVRPALGSELCGLRALGSLMIAQTLQLLTNNPTNNRFDFRRSLGRNRSKWAEAMGGYAGAEVTRWAQEKGALPFPERKVEECGQRCAELLASFFRWGATSALQIAAQKYGRHDYGYESVSEWTAPRDYHQLQAALGADTRTQERPGRWKPHPRPQSPIHKAQPSRCLHARGKAREVLPLARSSRRTAGRSSRPGTSVRPRLVLEFTRDRETAQLFR